MKILRDLCSLFFVAPVLVVQVLAQSLTLSGVVTDSQSHIRVGGANVSATGGQAAHSAVTDSEGTFILPLSEGVKKGDVVRIRVQKDGYLTYDHQVPVSVEVPLQVALVPSRKSPPPPPHAGESRVELEKLYEFGSGWALFINLINTDPKDPGKDSAEWSSAVQQLAFQLNDRLNQYSLGYKVEVPSSLEAASAEVKAMTNMITPLGEAISDRRGRTGKRALRIGLAAGTFTAWHQLQGKAKPSFEDVKAAVDAQLSGLNIKAAVTEAFLKDPVHDHNFESAIVDALSSSRH